MSQQVEAVSFEARARLLELLGEQLIRDSGLAVFELVKNAYDADATYCKVTMFDIDDPVKGRIVIEDNGSGMTPDIIKNVWLVIGTDYRAKQKRPNHEKWSPRFKRLPLGEKGIGRLAIHKLGRDISIVSRSAGKDELELRANWDDFEKPVALNGVDMTLQSRKPQHFTGNQTGTRIEVTRLREPWTLAKVRSLHRSVTSLCSPFDAPDSFNVEFTISPAGEWFKGLLDAREVLQIAPYRAHGWFEGDKLHLNYDFKQLPGIIVEERKVRNQVTNLTKVVGRKTTPLNLGKYNIGKVSFDFYMFDLETEVLKAAHADKASLRGYLAENGGVRIYRDGIRVFDFGEPGNDWLNLDARRINRPTSKTGNRQILGAVQLDAQSSAALQEKTNREGFIENEAFDDFREAVIWVLTQAEAERSKDQEKVRLHYSRSGPKKKPVLAELADLRDDLAKRGWLPEVEGHINRIEKQFNDVQDTLLRAAVPGLTFGSVVHEAEKVVMELVEAVNGDSDMARVRKLVGQLSHMMDGLTFLIRKSGFTQEMASALIEQALFNTEYRLSKHGFTVTNGIAIGTPDFRVRCVRRLIVGSLMNFIDNAIFWVESIRRTDHELYIGTTMDLDSRPAIVVADNGPGFLDEPETLVQPFYSRKPDGMGLGLHLADEIAKQHSGRLLFPAHGDVSLPKQFTGAIVAIQFPVKS